jgi:uncharacterized protein (DUF1697 family)
MAQLRARFEALGFTNVRTLIQSGNVVFESTRVPVASRVEAALADEFGFAIPVMLRTAPALRAVLRANPFPPQDAAHVSIGFYGSKPRADVVKQLDAKRWLPERFVIAGTELFLYLPNGIGRSKLPPYLDRNIKVPATVRNLNTVTKLVEMSQ